MAENNFALDILLPSREFRIQTLYPTELDVPTKNCWLWLLNNILHNLADENFIEIYQEAYLVLNLAQYPDFRRGDIEARVSTNLLCPDFRTVIKVTNLTEKQLAYHFFE